MKEGRFLGQTAIGLKVRDFSRISEPHNPLQGFPLEVILFREIGIFRFLIYMRFHTIQHMLLGFTWLLLTTQNLTFPKTAHTIICTVEATWRVAQRLIYHEYDDTLCT